MTHRRRIPVAICKRGVRDGVRHVLRGELRLKGEWLDRVTRAHLLIVLRDQRALPESDDVGFSHDGSRFDWSRATFHVIGRDGESEQIERDVWCARARDLWTTTAHERRAR
jgi:hypothetical protein